MGKKKDQEGDIEMLDDTTQNDDPVNRLFGIELESVVKNQESEADPDKTMKEHVLKLSCHIDNNNNPINSLQEGLEISLVGDIEKYSEAL
jgi:hypothetical protein